MGSVAGRCHASHFARVFWEFFLTPLQGPAPLPPHSGRSPTWSPGDEGRQKTRLFHVSPKECGHLASVSGLVHSETSSLHLLLLWSQVPIIRLVRH